MTDVVMPGINGRELVARIRQRHPALKTLFMSGYAESEADRRHLSDRATPYLQKPFTPASLAKAVRDTLDGRASAVLT